MAKPKKKYSDLAKNEISFIKEKLGITKIQESAPKILHFTDNFFKGNVDDIHIKNDSRLRKFLEHHSYIY